MSSSRCCVSKARERTKGNRLNGKLAKRLRKLAKFEMSANAETIDRELVLATVKGYDRVINEPMSVRAFYLRLKEAYGDATRSSVAQKQRPSDD